MKTRRKLAYDLPMLSLMQIQKKEINTFYFIKMEANSTQDTLSHVMNNRIYLFILSITSSLFHQKNPPSKSISSTQVLMRAQI